MFDNIGGKIKILSRVIGLIGVVSSIIGMIGTWINGGFSRYGAGGFTIFLSGLLVGALGCLASWIGAFFSYGFGQLIGDTSAIRRRIVPPRERKIDEEQ